MVVPLRVYPGVALAQICFHEVDDKGPTYHGKYTQQQGPRSSGLWKEFQHKT